MVDSTGMEFRYAMNWDGEYAMKSRCSTRMLSCNLIEISTLPNEVNQYYNVKIQRNNSIGGKYCDVKFRLPNLYVGSDKYAGYRIEVNTDYGIYIEESDIDSCLITLDEGDSINGFTISPLFLENYFDNGMFMGSSSLKYSIKIPINGDNITIDIPISDNYFREWRIDREFIKILSDSELIWRGYLYKLEI